VSTIAGHTFSGINGFCECGRRLSDISFAAYDRTWVGKSGIAHTASLTETEHQQILAAVEALYARAMI